MGFTGNPADIHMGAAAVYYDARCLGYTGNDSVKINQSITPTPITPDQTSLPIKDIITEMSVDVDVTLWEISSDNVNMLPGVENGQFKDPIGIDMKAVAKTLRIVPLDTADPNVWELPSACPVITDGIGFVKNTPQGFGLNFKAYTDSSGVYLKMTTRATGE